MGRTENPEETSPSDNFRTGLAENEQLDPAGERWQSSTVPASELGNLVPPSDEHRQTLSDRITDAAAKAKSSLVGDEKLHYYANTDARQSGDTDRVSVYRFSNAAQSQPNGGLFMMLKNDASSLAAAAGGFMFNVKNNVFKQSDSRDVQTTSENTSQKQQDNGYGDRNLVQQEDNGVRNLPCNTGDYKDLTDSTLGSVAIGVGPFLVPVGAALIYHLAMWP